MENWINNIELPDDSGNKEPENSNEPWINSIDLPDDSGWIDRIELPDDSGNKPNQKEDGNGREHANDLRRRRIM